MNLILDGAAHSQAHRDLDELAWRMDDVELELSCWHVTFAGALLVPSTDVPQ